MTGRRKISWQGCVRRREGPSARASPRGRAPLRRRPIPEARATSRSRIEPCGPRCTTRAKRAGEVRLDRRTGVGDGFVLGRDGTRPEVIAEFEAAERARLADPIGGRPSRRAGVRAMHGKRLFRWCAPPRRHGDVHAGLPAEPVAQEEAGQG